MTELEDAEKKQKRENCPSTIKLNWRPTPKVTPGNYTRCKSRERKNGSLKYKTKRGQSGDHTESWQRKVIPGVRPRILEQVQCSTHWANKETRTERQETTGLSRGFQITPYGSRIQEPEKRTNHSKKQKTKVSRGSERIFSAMARARRNRRTRRTQWTKPDQVTSWSQPLPPKTGLN